MVWKPVGQAIAARFLTERNIVVGHYVDMTAPLSAGDYQYLVDRGMRYQADQVVENYGMIEEDVVADENVPYADWNVPGLKEELNARQIEFDSKAKKADLVALLEEDDETNPDKPADGE